MAQMGEGHIDENSHGVYLDEDHQWEQFLAPIDIDQNMSIDGFQDEKDIHHFIAENYFSQRSSTHLIFLLRTNLLNSERLKTL